MNAASLVTQLASTKDEIERFSASAIRSVKEGEVSALKIEVQLRAFEKVVERIREGIRENVLNEAANYEAKFELFGNSLEKAEFATRYDYTVSNDPEWNQLDAIFKTADANRKEREKFLRSLTKPMDVLDRETGELVTIRPPLKSSVSGIKVNFR